MKVLGASTALTGRINPMAFEYGPSATSATSPMTRRKLFGRVALSGLALSSVGTMAASASLATAQAAGLTRLSLNENPLGPSPLAVGAIQNALTGIARYAGDDAYALEQQIANREGVSPDQIILGEILDSLGLQLALEAGTGGEFIYSEPGYSALVDAVAPGGRVVVEPDFAQKTAVELTRSGTNVVVFRTFGKIYGLAGMPIGYAVAPKRVADSLKRNGLGAAHSLNRLALTAAAASLRDPGYVDGIRSKLIEERQKWHTLLDMIGRRRSDSRGNFVFFETGQPHGVVAAQLMNEGIEIARAFPPFDHWVRISIGLPAENLRARDAIKKVLG